MFYKKTTSSWIKVSLSDFVSFSYVDLSTATLLKLTWTVKSFRIKSFETFLIEMNEHFTIFWFRCTRFSVRPATCSVRCDMQTIIVSFDKFTSMPFVFWDRPGQIFSKVNLEVLLWIFSWIRKCYTFHTLICILLQIWRTTTAWIITPRNFRPTLFCNSIFYDVWLLSFVSCLKAWFAADILWLLGKFARCWLVFTNLSKWSRRRCQSYPCHCALSTLKFEYSVDSK